MQTLSPTLQIFPPVHQSAFERRAPAQARSRCPQMSRLLLALCLHWRCYQDCRPCARAPASRLGHLAFAFATSRVPCFSLGLLRGQGAALAAANKLEGHLRYPGCSRRRLCHIVVPHDVKPVMFVTSVAVQCLTIFRPRQHCHDLVRQDTTPATPRETVTAPNDEPKLRTALPTRSGSCRSAARDPGRARRAVRVRGCVETS